jgi:hypothetical protein
MKKRVAILIAAALVALGGFAPTALAAPHGPHPQPPKCTPASTPGCS